MPDLPINLLVGARFGMSVWLVCAVFLSIDDWRRQRQTPLWAIGATGVVAALLALSKGWLS